MHCNLGRSSIIIIVWLLSAGSTPTLVSDEDSSDGCGGPPKHHYRRISGIGSIMVGWCGDAGSHRGFKAAADVRKVQCDEKQDRWSPFFSVSLTSHIYCDRKCDLCIFHLLLSVSLSPTVSVSLSISDLNFQFDSIAVLA